MELSSKLYTLTGEIKNISNNELIFKKMTESKALKDY
jgi:hypothetical protein